MDLGSLFLILALLIFVGLFIARPFIESRTKGVSLSGDPQEHKRSALLAERDRILNALQELDFDHQLGKIPEEDYPRQRTLLLQRGADVFRQLDMVASETTTLGAEERLEAAVDARRMDAQVLNDQTYNDQPSVGAALAGLDDDLEVLLAERRRARQEKAVGFCPKCGRPLQKSDRYCPKCGAKI